MSICMVDTINSIMVSQHHQAVPIIETTQGHFIMPFIIAIISITEMVSQCNFYSTEEASYIFLYLGYLSKDKLITIFVFGKSQSLLQNKTKYHKLICRTLLYYKTTCNLTSIFITLPYTNGYNCKMRWACPNKELACFFNFEFKAATHQICISKKLKYAF